MKVHRGAISQSVSQSVSPSKAHLRAKRGAVSQVVSQRRTRLGGIVCFAFTCMHADFSFTHARCLFLNTCLLPVLHAFLLTILSQVLAAYSSTRAYCLCLHAVLIPAPPFVLVACSFMHVCMLLSCAMTTPLSRLLAVPRACSIGTHDVTAANAIHACGMHALDEGTCINVLTRTPSCGLGLVGSGRPKTPACRALARATTAACRALVRAMTSACRTFARARAPHLTGQASQSQTRQSGFTARRSISTDVSKPAAAAA